MKLSIITRVLNVEDTIQQTIDSVIPVLSDDVEWVFVDGGSTDGTIDIVTPYTKPVIVPGTTLYEGFNSGLKLATGDYVLYLNSGDLLVPEGGFKRLLCALGDYDIYSFGAYLPDGQIFKPQGFDVTPYRMPFSHQGCVIRKKLLDELGGFNPYIGTTADHELILKCYLNDATHYSVPGVSIVRCSPFGATEDFIGRTLNRWRNTRNLYKKYRPQGLSHIDTSYKDILLTGFK